MATRIPFEQAAVDYVLAKREYDLATAKAEQAAQAAASARRQLDMRQEALFRGNYIDGTTGAPRFVVVDRTLLTLRHGDPASGDMMSVDVRPVDIFDSDGRAA